MVDINMIIAVAIGIGIIGVLWRNSDKESSCEHQWETIKEIDVYQYPSDTMPYKKIYILRCKKCGDIKEKHCKG